MIFESDVDSVRHQVAQTISDAPYLALATKKQIGSLIENCLSMNDIKTSQKDLTKFAGKIYEMKKPIKQYVLNVLNEKYGIDVRKLDEVPTFRTLAMTEAEILSQIVKHTTKGSIIEKTLSEFVNILNAKNGAETIDLAVYLEDLFRDAGHEETLNEASLMDYMDFTKVADDLGKIGQVLKMLVPAVETAASQLEDQGEEEMGDEEEDSMGSPDDLDSDSEVPMDEPNMDAEEAAQQVKDEEAEASEEAEEEAPQPAEEDPQSDDDPDEDEPEEMDQDELTSILSKLEDLLDDIKTDEDEDKKDKDPEQYKT